MGRFGIEPNALGRRLVVTARDCLRSLRAVSGAPASEGRPLSCVGGRSGYSDLKEALTAVSCYGLSMGLSGYGAMFCTLLVNCVGRWKAWGGAWKVVLNNQEPAGVGPQSIWRNARRTDCMRVQDTSRVDRKAWRFIKRTFATAVSGAGVELLRAAGGRASSRHKPDTSRSSEGDPLQTLRLERACSLNAEVSGSRAATGERVAGWPKSRSCGCGRSAVGVDGAGSDAGTRRPATSSASSCCRERNLSSGR